MEFDDGNLEIEGYNIAKSDHHSNSRQGEVCIFYQQLLLLKIDILNTIFNISENEFYSKH